MALLALGLTSLHLHAPAAQAAAVAPWAHSWDTAGQAWWGDFGYSLLNDEQARFILSSSPRPAPRRLLVLPPPFLAATTRSKHLLVFTHPHSCTLADVTAAAAPRTGSFHRQQLLHGEP